MLFGSASAPRFRGLEACFLNSLTDGGTPRPWLLSLPAAYLAVGTTYRNALHKRAREIDTAIIWNLDLHS